MKSRLSLVHQHVALRQAYPDSSIRRFREDYIIWEHEISPSALSNVYKVQLRYVRNKGAKVFVLKPSPLPLAKGHTRLPHVFSHENQELCLYYQSEWDTSMLYTQTLIPWTYEWLLHYELWAGNGEWTGGGIKH